MSAPIDYVGEELELFAEAENWKSYLAHLISPRLGARVLEVGAGLGATTRALCRRAHDQWVCLEPDARLAARCGALVASGELPAFCRVVAGTLADLPPAERFDSILYVDVLEHIPDDRAELAAAAAHLEAGGNLTVLSPAHQWLFTPFDAAIGHCRRYSRSALARIAPSGLKCVRLVYLDSLGLVASFGNRALLRQSMPTARQIRFWDRTLVRASRRLDAWFGYRLGKSVLGEWIKS